MLEQRWNARLGEQHRVERELQELSDASAPLSSSQEATLRTLGENFSAVWNDAACPMVLKERITRLLIKEIVVDIDATEQQLNLVIHWQGGCHTTLAMPKPLSGAVAHKAALEDVDLITRTAPRCGDDEIARVLSKLGRRMGKGNRWTQSRDAPVRRKHGIPSPAIGDRDPNPLNLAQAQKHCAVSDTTLMRLIKANLLPAAQVAPYAPLEIKRADLDSEPVAGILERLKKTGKLLLDGEPPVGQTSLF